MLKILPKSKTNSFYSGQTYIDVLIVIAVVVVLASALFTLVVTAFDLVAFNRTRITARHLATQKMEFIRNLAYQNIGVVGGIPSGPLAPSEIIEKNSLQYTINTQIIYIDDPFDQLSPQDTIPTDYKRVKVQVSWQGQAASHNNPVVITTDIAPPGAESTGSGGTLSVLVFNAYGQPVPQANVHILAPDLDPPVDLNLTTNDQGQLIIPGTPVCQNCYQITVTKENYSTDRTYSFIEVVTPHKPHQTVLEKELTEISFAIDQLSSLNIFSFDNRQNNFQPLPDQPIIIRGEKTIGLDINNQPVYKFQTTIVTDDQAQLTLSDLEWDNYYFFTPSGSGLDIAGTNPLIPLTILPDQTQDLSLSFTPHTDHSLLLSFVNDSLTPIASVSAKISLASGFQATSSSGLNTYPDFGQTIFSGLLNQIYTLQASASGYLNYQDNVEVSGTASETIILETN